MSGQYSNESMLDMYIFETAQNIEHLEDSILSGEKSSCYTPDAINEIFRIMHTIKGSSAMMLFTNISTLAHAIEDLFYFLRDQHQQHVDCSTLSDLIFEAVDFIKVELHKIKNGDKADGDPSTSIENIKGFLAQLKQQNATQLSTYKATLFFEDGCEMENIRAYAVIHNLQEITQEIRFIPEDIIDNDDCVQVIREKGFTVFVKVDKSYDEILEFFRQTVFLKDLEMVQLENNEDLEPCHEFHQFSSDRETDSKVTQVQYKEDKEHGEKELLSSSVQSIISVNVGKLDKLLDLVGEMVIAEAMVTQNPDLKGLQLENFQKAARQLHKITSELQDMVMSIRMVPLSTTFHKMHRIVRDMSKKLDKDVELRLLGEETEVDKNIIEHISDPLMHLVRNSIDHGIEAVEERIASGKPKTGIVTLEAKNAGSDVLIIVKDNGEGLQKEKILNRAKENGLLTKPENEMSDREIYNLIFLPGFSTKEKITEFSGRGVGMDVVIKNIEAVGGSISVDSTEGTGSTVTLKIPLTLAIIDGMNIRVGSSRYTLPITAIRESFRPKAGEVIQDPDGNEMIMVRGQCYPILRLHEHFGVKSERINFTEGILIMVEQDGKVLCVLADELLGQQQVVVKALPNYIKSTKKVEGLAGCTLLGDGSISLILDVDALVNR